MSHTYTEDQLVEHPAVELFRKLAWNTISAREEILGTQGTLERETSAEVLLLKRLRRALENLNPARSPSAIAAAVDEFSRDRSAMTPAAANREI